jgi:hypothetical protein
MAKGVFAVGAAPAVLTVRQRLEVLTCEWVMRLRGRVAPTTVADLRRVLGEMGSALDKADASPAGQLLPDARTLSERQSPESSAIVA